MKIDKRYQLDKAVSKDNFRPILSDIYGAIHNDKQVAVATNGTILAAVPATFDSDEDNGVLPINAYIAARKATKGGSFKKPAVVNVLLNSTATVEKTDMTMVFKRNRSVSGIPSWTNVIPKAEPTTKLYIDTKLLHDLAQAIGTTQVEIHVFESKSDPWLVKPYENGNEAFGVICPLRAKS